MSSTFDLDRVNALLASIYDAALDHAVWPDALQNICNAVNTRSGLIRVQNLHTNRVGTLITVGLDPSFAKKYQEHFVHLDDLVPTIATRPVAKAHQVATLMPESFFKGEFYNDYALPQGQEQSMGCSLTSNRAQFAVLGLHRPLRSGRFSRSEEDFVELLTPHLQRALRISHLVQQTADHVAAAREALHRLSVGVVLVDDSAKPVFLNAQAEALIDERAGLDISRGSLRVGRWTDTQRLHGLIFDAARAETRRGGSMSVSVPGRAHDLTIQVTPVSVEQETCFQFEDSRVAAALFIGKTDDHQQISLDVLKDLYGLTPAEARLTAALTAGESLDAIAERFGLSLHTVRTQLKACFRKTGVGRQAELVNLVLRGPAALIDYSRR